MDQPIYFVNTGNENSLSRGVQKNINKQSRITGEYFKNSLQEAPIPKTEKDQYVRAMNFGACRSVYHDAKLLYRDQVGWLQRQKRINSLCRNINRKGMKYPNTVYCNMLALPVRWRLTIVIDAIAWKMSH